MCDGHNFTTYSRSRSRPLGQLAWREVVDFGNVTRWHLWCTEKVGNSASAVQRSGKRVTDTVLLGTCAWHFSTELMGS